MSPETAEAPDDVVRTDSAASKTQGSPPDTTLTEPGFDHGSQVSDDLVAEMAELRAALARLDSERDAFVHLLLAAGSTTLGHAGMRWQAFAGQHPWAQRLFSRPAHWLWMVLTLRWPGGLRVNPLFDEGWYRERYPDAPAGRRAAYRQYRALSLSEGRDPDPLFDTDWYLAHNPDVEAGRLHPLDHYLIRGWRELRDPGPDFNGFDYLRQNPECVTLAMCPLEHLIRSEGTGSIHVVPDPVAAGTGSRSSVRRTRDFYQRYGARRTLARVASQFLAGQDGASRSGAGHVVVANVHPEVIRAHLDTPRAGAPEGASALLVTGWACSDVGIDTIDAYIDEAPAGSLQLGQPRPDVAAALPGVSGSAESGFTGRIDLEDVEPGRHHVQVAIRATDGSSRTLFSSFERIEPESMYHHYYVRSLPSPAEASEMEHRAASTSGLPQFLCVVIDDGHGDLRMTLTSVAAQSYPAKHCVIVTSAGGVESARALLEDLGVGDTDGAWTIATMAADIWPAGQADDRMVGFLHAGETLAPTALFSYAAQVAEADVTLVYSDHDAVRPTGQHVEPWFLPEWSPDYQLSRDYIGGVFMVRDDADLREAVRRTFEDGGRWWRYELLLTLGASPSFRAARVPRVLWSRPPDGADIAGRPEAEQEAVVRALQASGTAAEVTTIDGAASGPIRRLTHALGRQPSVSVVIPTTGKRDLVEGTLDLLGDGTDYPDLELIFVDNSRGQEPDSVQLLEDAGATVLERDEPFNWAKLNNDGARVATGDYLLFLNDDMASLGRRWLSEMMRHATRPGVGAVGAALFFPGGEIQHAGVVVVGHGGGAVHLFHQLDPDDGLYLDLHRVAREVTAVTGACLLVRRSVFNELGGFDKELAIVGNDVDFCLRLSRTGRRTVWTPDAQLVHFESMSRSGISHLPDESRMWDRWSDVLLGGDPYYDPNLAQDRVDCGLDWGRLEGRPDPIALTNPAAGVNLVGYISAEMGVGQATRGEAQALWDADVPFVIIEHRQGNPARMDDRSWSHKVREEPVFDTNILHLNADVLAAALTQLPDGLRDDRRNIGYWTWELPDFPSQWRAAFELVDEVWVPSTFVRDAIGADAPVPVRVLPHAVQVSASPGDGRARFDLPEDAFVFLAMYDTHSVRARKNPDGALAAFEEAFGRDEGVHLVLKVNNSDHRELDALRDTVAGLANISMITDTLPRVDMDALMSTADAFVSLHRSEGFGLPIAEAMARGRPVVVTGWSGNMDFTDEENAALVDYRLVTLERSFGPYEKGQRWAEPDIDDAARRMRALRDDRALAAALGLRAAESVQRTLSPAVIGSRMSEYLFDA